METDKKGTERRVSRLVPSQVLEDEVSCSAEAEAEEEEEEEEEEEIDDEDEEDVSEEEKAARVRREGAWQRSDVTTLKATSP